MLCLLLPQSKRTTEYVSTLLVLESHIKAVDIHFTVFRFEEEILTSQQIGDMNGDNSAGARLIIGSGTFEHVKAQLVGQPSAETQAMEVTTSSHKPNSLTTKPRLTFSGFDTCFNCSL